MALALAGRIESGFGMSLGFAGLGLALGFARLCWGMSEARAAGWRRAEAWSSAW